MDGYITTQIFKDANNFAFVFIFRLRFVEQSLLVHKSTSRDGGPCRTNLKFRGTYLKLARKASGEYPVCFLKNRIKYETSSYPS